VLTYQDVPGDPRHGLVENDWPVFAGGEYAARYVGDPIALVVAESEVQARAALDHIHVTYEVLPAVVDFLEGLKASTAKQWDNKLDGTIIGVTQPFVRGKGDAALTEGDVVVETVASKPFEQHVALELSNSLTWWDNNKLIHVGTVRHAHGRRDRMSQWLGVPQSNVRIITPGYVGSSYGSHRDPDWQDIISAVMAKLVARPVKALATRSEDFVVRTHRAQTRSEGKMAVKRDGSIVAASFKVTSNVGAFRASAASGGWIGYQQLYNIPNLKLEAIDVFTNMYRYGSFRCVQHPAATFAQEILIDKAAYAIKMDPLEIRLKNINMAGNLDTKKPYSNPGTQACLEQAATAIGWKAKWHAPKAKEVRPGVFHGIGIAAHTCSHGAGGAPSTATVVINGDGTLTVVSGAAEVGAGERTIMAMIASEVLGIPYERVGITPDVDTDYTADTGNTAGSRQTISGGWGVYEAAVDAKNQMLDWAARKFVADAKAATPSVALTLKGADLDVAAGSIFQKADPTKKMLVRDAVTAANNPILGRGAHIHEGTWERMAFAAHAAEVEVDTVTGAIKILKYVAAHDVGRAINPLGTEQQIEGGVIMAIGAALVEENIVDQSTGLPLNDNILEYKTLTIKDIPRTIDIILVEYNKAYGVWGAHGIGEPPMALPAPVLSNAIYNAVGVRLESAPMTRVKLLTALKSA
jgi:CO/xanthine dehydrogenase Mo-binding subunit